MTHASLPSRTDVYLAAPTSTLYTTRERVPLRFRALVPPADRVARA